MPMSSGPPERGPAQARRWARRRSAGAVALAIVTCVALVFAVPIANGLLNDQPDRPSGGDPWEQLPRPPANEVLRGPELGSAVWTGTEVILLAEFAYSPPIPSPRPPDGLAYNPATGRWRALPEPPPDQSIGGGRVGTVWTGKEVILLYATGAPIAYDPDANTWRRFARPPTGFISHAADPAPIWTGAEVLVWDDSSRDEATGKVIHGGRGAAYNPQTDRWRPLPRSPLTNRTWAIQAWTGSQLLVVAGSCGDSGEIRCQDGAAYDPDANTWTPIPALPGGALAGEAASTWIGSELIIWSATTSQDGLRIRNAARSYNPRSRRWRTLPPAPITPRRLAAAVWAGDRLLVWGGLRHLPGDRLAYPDDGAAYDPRGNRWQMLPKAPVPGRALPLTVWAGDRVIFIGGLNAGDRPRADRGNITAITEQGAAYHPVSGRSGG
jgi:N-acetylneuraminic acid mutarotase